MGPGTAPAQSDVPEGPRPRYTPDGRWFWTGEIWIPAVDVLNQRQAPVAPPPPPPKPAGPRWRVLISAALVVLLAAGVTVGLLVDRPGAHPTSPSAAHIFNLPFGDHVGSAGMTGTLDNQGVTEVVTGAIEFAPDRGLHATLYVGGAYVGEYLDSGGIDYESEEPGGPWVASAPVSLIDNVLGWAGGPPPAGLRVLGRQTVAGEPAWHLKAASGAEWWIGAATGHPLRFSYENGWAITLTFRDFGLQQQITAPPRSNISTLPIPGTLRTMINAPEMSMEVDSVESAPRGLGPPPQGYRFEALHVAYENDGPDPITFGNDFTLTGAHGVQYEQSADVQLSPVLPRGQVMTPGQAVSGWDVFVVAVHARDLTLRVGPQTGEEDVDFLVSIPLR